MGGKAKKREECHISNEASCGKLEVLWMGKGPGVLIHVSRRIREELSVSLQN